MLPQGEHSASTSSIYQVIVLRDMGATSNTASSVLLSLCHYTSCAFVSVSVSGAMLQRKDW